uniref:Actin, putative n=1 Tax=Entamoeba histolytica TaxID=5759 RepID=S0AWV9_ENTHI|nr:actin, putative [Entamoeba histolytica]
MSTLPAVVLDNGTGYTKIGYAGNTEPSYLIPSLIAVDSKADLNTATKSTEDFDFYIGQEAENAPKSYTKTFPLKHGQIENWTLMEMYWEQAIFKYLRCDPQDHYFLLTEPPMNPPENREYLAEVFFEAFNVPGMYIAVQAVLAIVASWSRKDNNPANARLTGTVIDSGDGVTHIIPVADGYVIGSSIKSIPLAGKDITAFIQQMLVEREEPIPASERMEMARTIKENYSFVSKDMCKEFSIMDSGNDPKSSFKKHQAIDPISKKPYTFDVGYEQFLAPELFFNPEIFSSDFTTPLADLVDDSIQSCPIDCRRDLYKNIILSGGSTMFKGFGHRLQRDVRRFTDFRTQKAVQLSGGKLTPKPMEVNVVSYPYQRYAVWYGGSVMAELPVFVQHCHSKAEYEEKGPSICRYNHVFVAC